MSCMTAVQDKGNHVKFARYVLLAVSEEAKTLMFGFGFIPSFPHFPQQCCGPKKHSFLPILLNILILFRVGREGSLVLLIARFSNRAGTLLDDGVRKSNNWLDQ